MHSHASYNQRVRKELQAVLVKAAHGGEVVSESFGVSGFQLLNQQPDVVGNEFLFGVGLLAVDGGDGAGVGCAAHGVFSFAVAFAFHAMRGMYLHAERLLAKAGGSNCKPRGIPTLERSGRAERSGGLHKRSAEDWGSPLWRAIGAEPLSVLSTSVTKQTGDMVYSGARRLSFPGLVNA